MSEEDRRERIPAFGHNCSFPRKVHALLQYAQRNDLDNVACWSADGKAFQVLNPDEFMEKIAPHFFPNHSSFRSFERMLNIWGFKRERAPLPHKFFWNSNFQRERPELCRNMSRIENKGTKKRIAVSRIQSYIHVKKNLPIWAQEHQQAALKYFSDQSTQKAKDAPKMARTNQQNGNTQQLESQDDSYGRLRGLSAHNGLTLPMTVTVPHQVPLNLPDQLPSSVSAKRRSHQCEKGLESHEKERNSKNNQMPSEKLKGKRDPSFAIGEDVCDTGLETQVQDKGSPSHKKAFLGGQFDDAPDSLLVLANAAVSDHRKKDS